MSLRSKPGLTAITADHRTLMITYFLIFKAARRVSEFASSATTCLDILLRALPSLSSCLLPYLSRTRDCLHPSTSGGNALLETKQRVPSSILTVIGRPPSKPQVVKNEKTVSVHMARPAVASFLRNLKKAEREAAEIRETHGTLSVPNVKTEVHLEKLKRVALKMAVGLAELLKFPLSLEADTVQYLLGAYDSDSTVLADDTVHESLESLRPRNRTRSS